MEGKTMKLDKDMTFRDVLSIIDQWSTKAACGEGRKLWLVLTALRGPDNNDCDLKAKTTEIIRSKSLPNLALAGGAYVARTRKVVRLNLTEDIHFSSHTLQAARVLEITVVKTP